jgi:hypothetical protein
MVFFKKVLGEKKKSFISFFFFFGKKVPNFKIIHFLNKKIFIISKGGEK